MASRELHVPYGRPPHGYTPLQAIAPSVMSSARSSTTAGVMKNLRLCDIVQFSTQVFYVDESDGEVTLEVVRLGYCRGNASVRYRTEDGSAKGGDQFSHCEGELVFGDDVKEQTLSVSLLADESWHKTNYFRVELFDPEGCALAGPLSVARVRILDSDRFPSNKYHVLQTQGEEGCRAISGPGLFWEYFKLSLRQPGMRWRTYMTLVLDQLHNVFLLLKTWMSKYLVDVVFNVKSPESSEKLVFFRRDRLSEAKLLALLFTLPLVLLHVWDVVKVKIDIEGHQISFLRTNLVGRYMNFTEESRHEVNPIKLQFTIMSDAYQLSKGYTALLETARSLGTVAVFLAFAMYSNPGAWPIVMVAMPSIMLLFFVVRAFCIERPEDSFPAQRALLVFVAEITRNYKVIANYFQRPKIQDLAIERITTYREMRLPEKVASIHEDYFIQWLGAVCVSAYICLMAPAVLGMGRGVPGAKSEVSIGTFLATIAIIQQVSEAFACLFSMYIQLVDTFDPVRDFTYIFNLPTDVGKCKDIIANRLAATRKSRQEAEKERRTSETADGGAQLRVRFPVDGIKLCLEDLSVQYMKGHPVLDGVNISLEQGQMVAVMGSHGSGKRSLLEVMGQSRFPREGRVFMPGHLRTLQVQSVAQGPCLFESWSPMENLCFGLESHEIDALRIRTVLGTLLMRKVLKLVEPDLGEVVTLHVGDDEAGAQQPPEIAPSAREHTFNNPHNWAQKLSSTELSGICLARALIANPEVLILHVPFAGLEQDAKMCVKRALLEHRRNRGIGMPEDWQEMRRPRTTIFSVNDSTDCDVADTVWGVSKSKVHVVQGRPEAEVQEATTEPPTISPARSATQTSVTQSQEQSPSKIQRSPLQESDKEVCHPFLQKELHRRMTGREYSMASGSTCTGVTTLRSNSALFQEQRFERSHGPLLESPQELQL